MPPLVATYGERTGITAHRSFFRLALAARARPVPEGQDAVEEYLIDQANLRGFLGAYSDRADRGTLDAELRLEELVVGLLQPHAPADLRVIKLVTRILQSGDLDVDRLVLIAKRERALPILAWIVELCPSTEVIGPLRLLAARFKRTPPREHRRPRIVYSPERLLRPRS